MLGGGRSIVLSCTATGNVPLRVRMTGTVGYGVWK